MAKPAETPVPAQLRVPDLRARVDKHIDEHLQMPWTPEDVRAAAVLRAEHAIGDKLRVIVARSVSEQWLNTRMHAVARAKQRVVNARARAERAAAKAAKAAAVNNSDAAVGAPKTAAIAAAPKA